MIHTVRIPANHATVIPVQIDGKIGPQLLQVDPALIERLYVGDSLLQLNDDDTTAIIVLNHSDSTCILQRGEKIGTGENGQLCQLLCDYHDILSLEEGVRGETSLVEIEVDTGQTLPKKQPSCRMPYSAHQEIVNQLQKIESNGVI